MADALTARIAADAQANLPPKPLWCRLLAGIGGPAGLGGMATATVAGFWLGVVPPAETLDPLVLIGTVETAAQTELMDLTGFDLAGFEFDTEDGWNDG